MDPRRFDTLTRSLLDPRSRREAIAALLGGPLGLLALNDAVAKKGKNKKKRKKNKKKDKRKQNQNGGTPTGQPPPSPSCAATCASNCDTCAYRAAGPTLCGDGYASESCDVARICSSDNDCVENPAYPYCIASGEDRATGRPYPPCADGKSRCSVILEC